MTSEATAIDINFHEVQGLAFQSEAQEILYGGAAGGGKSYFLRAAAIIWAMMIPGLQVYLFRRQFPDLEKNHLQGPTSFPILLQALILSGHVVWNQTKFKFTFWNGSVIHLCHCQREQDRYNYLGAEIHVLLIDELSQFTPVIYRFLRTRVRMVGVSVPAHVKGKFPRIICGSNPGGPCHSYMRMGWVDAGIPKSIFRAPANDGGLLRQFIPAKIADNPSLERDDPEYRERIKGLGDPALVKAYLDGDFSIISGGMFDDLWSPSTHILRPFRLPYSWYIDRSFDWGSAKPFSVGYWARSDGTEVVVNGVRKVWPRGTMFRIGEWYGWTGEPDQGLKYTDEQIAEGIKAMDNQFRVAGYNVFPGPADSAIFDDENPENCTAGRMEARGIYWERADKRPGSRKLGIEEIRVRLYSALQEKIENPAMYVFDNCTQFIRTMPSLQRAENDPEDIKTKQEDHIFDETRYAARHEPTLVVGSNIRAF